MNLQEYNRAKECAKHTTGGDEAGNIVLASAGAQPDPVLRVARIAIDALTGVYLLMFARMSFSAVGALVSGRVCASLGWAIGALFMVWFAHSTAQVAADLKGAKS